MENIYLQCVAYECPKYKRDKNCPFYEIEHLSFREKIIWIGELDDEQRKAILKYHLKCSNSKKYSVVNHDKSSI